MKIVEEKQKAVKKMFAQHGIPVHAGSTSENLGTYVGSVWVWLKEVWFGCYWGRCGFGLVDSCGLAAV